jgi:tripartite-type tricarboxylate transporter receptor subunit TctC
VPDQETFVTAFARYLIALTLALSSLISQAFPVRTVVLVVPFTASSGSDIIARILAPKLSERWKQPVIVDNKPGASGNLGAQFVAQPC